MKKLNPNMTLRTAHIICTIMNCHCCPLREEDGTCAIKHWVPSGWKFEERPQVREVKRHAREGEYIKIVDASPYHNGYKNGDILRVSKCGSSGVIAGLIYIDNSEYVVLENYVPDKKETVPSAGDTERGNCENVREKTIAQPKENVNTSLVEMSPDGDLIIHPEAAAYVNVLQNAVSKALNGGAE